MRVYHFFSAKHALDAISNRRMKLSQIDEVNDPFELWCVSHKDRTVRAALRAYKAEMAQRFGLLCFSGNWHNPVLWSHYADRHRGMCLGFEVTDERILKAVRYVAIRSPLRLPPTPATMEQLNFTKYRDWSYENEWRGWVTLSDRDAATGFYFYAFDDKVQLSEVIAGPLCDTPKSDIQTALMGNTVAVRVIKARLAFRSFKVVEDHLGFSKH